MSGSRVIRVTQNQLMIKLNNIILISALLLVFISVQLKQIFEIAFRPKKEEKDAIRRRDAENWDACLGFFCKRCVVNICMRRRVLSWGRRVGDRERRWIAAATVLHKSYIFVEYCFHFVVSSFHCSSAHRTRQECNTKPVTGDGHFSLYWNTHTHMRPIKNKLMATYKMDIAYIYYRCFVCGSFFLWCL